MGSPVSIIIATEVTMWMAHSLRLL